MTDRSNRLNHLFAPRSVWRRFLDHPSFVELIVTAKKLC